MWQELVVVHRRGKDPLPHFEKESLYWQTCLRQILFLSSDQYKKIQSDLQGTDEIFSGSAAYDFCLQICSGLHSPIIGETEVFGQFKNFTNSINVQNQFSINFRKFADKIIHDTKTLREDLLKDLGAHSYGALLRKIAGDFETFCIVGSGQLAEELIPWLKNKKITLACRNLTRGMELANTFQNLHIVSLDHNFEKHDCIVVAAPIAAKEFSSRIRKNAPRLVIDLRGESKLDPLGKIQGTTILELDQFFSQIQEHKKHQLDIAERAFQFAKELADRRFSFLAKDTKHRPFGWEDVCA